MNAFRGLYSGTWAMVANAILNLDEVVTRN